jgi:hypothetical protein
MDPRGLFCFVPTPQEKDHSIRAVVLPNKAPINNQSPLRSPVQVRPGLRQTTKPQGNS